MNMHGPEIDTKLSTAISLSAVVFSYCCTYIYAVVGVAVATSMSYSHTTSPPKTVSSTQNNLSLQLL